MSRLLSITAPRGSITPPSGVVLPAPRARSTAIRAGVALVLTALGTATPLTAQTSADQQAAYIALIYTPVGGLAPLPPSRDTLTPRSRANVVWQGRLGRFTREGGLSMTALAIGAEWPRGRWKLGGTVAFGAVSCSPDWQGDPDCSGDLMIGGTARTTFLSRPLADGSGRRNASSDRLLVGFDASVGFSPRAGQQAIAFAAGLPVAYSHQGGDMRVTPFLTPALAFGRLGSVEYGDDPAPVAHGTIVPMVGGGVGIEFLRSGIGTTVGVQKVFKGDPGATIVGIGMTWQGPSVRR